MSEIYGPVCQGEGALIGRPTVFIRLGGCDYRCSWCDSLYAVDAKRYRHTWDKMDAWDIANTARGYFPAEATYRHVTLSGGNPAIHPLRDLCDALIDAGIQGIAIETQGTIAPTCAELFTDITVSPKPPSSGNITDPENPNLALWLSTASDAQRCLKVVAFDAVDYRYAKTMHLTHPTIPFVVQAGTLVGTATRDDLCDALNDLQATVLADPAMQDVAVLPQLHAVLRGHARGI